jgi:type II secretory pathway pseudopilin PulG
MRPSGAQRRAPRGRTGTRGMTLVEALVAMTVLATGVAALFGMINRVQGANRSMAFQTNALDAFSRISAQIRDAECVLPNNAPRALNQTVRDPGLAQPLDAWVVAAVPGSLITLVGDGAANAELDRYVPPLRVDYRLRAGNVPAGGLPALEVQVRVREITRDPARDAQALEDGSWIRIFPVEKVCTSRLDDTLRGAYD